MYLLSLGNELGSIDSRNAINTTQCLSLRFRNETTMPMYLPQLIKMEEIIKSKVIKLQIRFITKGYFH